MVPTEDLPGSKISWKSGRHKIYSTGNLNNPYEQYISKNNSGTLWYDFLYLNTLIYFNSNTNSVLPLCCMARPVELVLLLNTVLFAGNNHWQCTSWRQHTESLALAIWWGRAVQWFSIRCFFWHPMHLTYKLLFPLLFHLFNNNIQYNIKATGKDLEKIEKEKNKGRWCCWWFKANSST